jgi:hypothetical protein
MNAATASNRRLFSASAGTLLAGLAIASPTRAEADSQVTARSAALIRRL